MESLLFESSPRGAETPSCDSPPLPTRAGLLGASAADSPPLQTRAGLLGADSTPLPTPAGLLGAGAPDSPSLSTRTGPLGCGAGPPSGGLPPAGPARPPAARPQTAGPRYLREAALKLADDSLRHSASGSCGTPAAPPEAFTPACSRPTTAGLTPAYSRPTTAGRARFADAEELGSAAAGDAEVWRRAFCAEARECVQAIQELFEGASITHVSSRFEDWRKFDVKATAQVQQHVKQLAQLNVSLGNFLQQCAGPAELAKITGTLQTLSQVVDEVRAGRADLLEYVPAAAKGAATEVVTAWRAETRTAVALLQRHVDSFAERCGQDCRWQAQADARVATLQASVERLCDDAREQRERLAMLETAQRTASERVAAALREWVLEGPWQRSFDGRIDRIQSSMEQLTSCVRAHQEQVRRTELMHSHNNDMLTVALKENVKEIQEASRRTVDEFCEQLRKDAAADREEMRRYVQGVLTEIAGSTEKQLGLVHDQMREWEENSLAEATRWREEAGKTQDELTVLTRKADELRLNGMNLKKETERLTAQAQEMRQQLRETNEELELARGATIDRGMRKLKEIEGRGHVRMNRQGGDIRTSLLEFVGPDAAAGGGGTAAPDAALRQPDVARNPLRDAAEIACLFDAPIAVQVHTKVPRGGSQNAWEGTAAARAELLRDHLINFGVKSDAVTTVGFAGSQVADAVIFQLDRSLFGGADDGGRKPTEQPSSGAPARRRALK